MYLLYQKNSSWSTTYGHFGFKSSKMRKNIFYINFFSKIILGDGKESSLLFAANQSKEAILLKLSTGNPQKTYKELSAWERIKS